MLFLLSLSRVNLLFRTCSGLKGLLAFERKWLLLEGAFFGVYLDWRFIPGRCFWLHLARCSEMLSTLRQPARLSVALLGVMPALGLPRHGLLLSCCYFTFTGLLVHENARKKTSPQEGTCGLQGGDRKQLLGEGILLRRIRGIRPTGGVVFQHFASAYRCGCQWLNAGSSETAGEIDAWFGGRDSDWCTVRFPFRH